MTSGLAALPSAALRDLVVLAQTQINHIMPPPVVFDVTHAVLDRWSAKDPGIMPWLTDAKALPQFSSFQDSRRLVKVGRNASAVRRAAAY